MGTFIRVYGPDRQARGLLPHHSQLTVQRVFSDAGVLTCRYPRNGVNAHLLDLPDAFLAVVEDGVELPEWFVLEDDGEDEADEAGVGRLIDVSARGTLSLLAEAVVYPGAHRPGKSPDGMEQAHEFKQATPGQILRTLFDRAQARGALKGIDFTNFTAAVDTNGVKWPKKYDVTYSVGLDYLSVVQAMVDNGWIDVHMERLELRVHVADGFSVDRPDVIMRLGQNVLEGPRKRSRRGVRSVMLGVGAEKTAVEVADASAVGRLGRREGFLGDGRATTVGSLRATATSTLEQQVRAQEGITLAVALDNADLAGTRAAWFQPGRDFYVGDWIRYDQRRLSPTALEPLRVRTFSWGWSNTDAPRTCSLELNDVFVEQSIRVARIIKGITNGSSSTTTSPPPANLGPGVVQDTTPPSPPGAMAVFSQVYQEERRWRTTVRLTWAAPTTSADGTDLVDLKGYQIATRFEFPEGWGEWSPAQPVDETFAQLDRMPAGVRFQARVRAVDDSENLSDWTESEQVTLDKDLTPPPPPSTPVLSDNLGSIRLAWDGMDADGGPMPFDFASVTVHLSTDAGFVADASNKVDEFLAATTTTLESAGWGVPVYARLIAVDSSENASPPSALAGPVTPRKIGAESINDDAIGYQQLAFKDAGNLVGDGSFETPAGRTFITSQPGGSRWRAVASTEADKAPLGSWYMRATPGGGSGATAVAITDHMPITALGGDKWWVRARVRLSNGVAPDKGLRYYLLPFTAAGTALASASYAEVTSARDGTWRVFGTYLDTAAMPAGAVTVRAALVLDTTVLAGETIDVDTIEVRRVTATELIDDAAITRAKISDLAVDDAKIANLNVGKLRTGILQADVTVSARIKTADSGQRVEVNSSGVQQYDSSGRLAVSIAPWGSSFSGNVTARTFYSAGYETYGTKYIEMGDVAGAETNDEVRFWNGSYVASVRNPTDYPGRLRFSGTASGGGFTIDFDPALGVISPRMTLHTADASRSYSTYLERAEQLYGGGGMRVHDGNNSYGSDLVIGSAENSHGWIANSQVGIKFLYSSPVVQIRGGQNSNYGDLVCRNLTLRDGGTISGAQVDYASRAGTADSASYATSAGSASGAYSGGSLYLTGGGYNGIVLNNQGSYIITQGGLGMYVAGDLSAGNKKFTIPHPLESDHWLVHGCTESPQAGVEYWGEVTLDDAGHGAVRMPRYFEALTYTEGRGVFLTSLDGATPASASRITDGTFSITGQPGSTVAWLVKATRTGADFDVEPRVDAERVPAPAHLYDFPADDQERYAEAQAAGRDAA